MKIYLVETTKWLGYDTYEGVVLCAESEADALEMARKECSWNDSIELKIKEVKPDNAGTVLTSFHAG